MDIIANIPDEIIRECLLRVTYKSHGNVKAVCRSWEAMLSRPRFYEDRKISGTREQFICLIQAIPQGNSTEDNKQGTPVYGLTLYDPLEGTWHRLPSIPEFPDGIPLFCHCVSVDQKLVVIGGWNPSPWETMKTVFIYDFTSCTWFRGANMPTVRSFFACSVSTDGIIYVAGGEDDTKSALRTAETYDVRQDKWEFLPPMSQERDRCHGVFSDGKFTVISGHATEARDRLENSAEVFDPSRGIWSRVETVWNIGVSPTSCLCTLGQMYFFQNQQLMRYNGKENVSEVLASLPESIDVATCATMWRDKIFVSGSTSRWGEQLCYMFHNSGKWVSIDRPHGFEGFVQTAITVEL